MLISTREPSSSPFKNNEFFSKERYHSNNIYVPTMPQYLGGNSVYILRKIQRCIIPNLKWAVVKSEMVHNTMGNIHSPLFFSFVSCGSNFDQKFCGLSNTCCFNTSKLFRFFPFVSEWCSMELVHTMIQVIAANRLLLVNSLKIRFTRFTEF